MRQWVLTLPYRLRYALAWDHRLCRAVLGVFIEDAEGPGRFVPLRAGIETVILGIFLAPPALLLDIASNDR